MWWLRGIRTAIALSLVRSARMPGDAPMLLPVGELVRTGPLDQGGWTYRRLLGWIIRQRFPLVTSLLPPGRLGRILEVGYGSGIFMPTLAARCEELHGIDIHMCNEQVAERLGWHGLKASLQVGSVEAMPYCDSSFDCVVAVSALDFVHDMRRAASELRRVLKRRGSLVTVLPGDSTVINAGFRVLTGKNPRTDFGDRRAGVLPALLRDFAIDKERSFPGIGGRHFRMYRALRMRPKETGSALES